MVTTVRHYSETMTLYCKKDKNHTLHTHKLKKKIHEFTVANLTRLMQLVFFHIIFMCLFI